MGPEGSDTHVTTRVMGTYGYAAPEYVNTGTNTKPVFNFLTLNSQKMQLFQHKQNLNQPEK